MTFDLRTDWVTKDGDPVDINAEFDKGETIEMMTAALQHAGHTVTRIGNYQALVKQIDTFNGDLIFNICEGYAGRNRESQVPILLEMKGIPHVGADALTLGMTLDKVVAKKIFIADGIRTPKFFVARDARDVDNQADIPFPVIVKTRHEGTSKGLTEKSVVSSVKDLKEQVEYITRSYRQPALVEEFIKGTEFTIGIIGNDDLMVSPPIQVSIDGDVNLGDKFFTFEMVSYKGLGYVCPARISKELTNEMVDMAVKTYRSVECRDFGRVDFRVDEYGIPYVLEINPYPSLASNDVFNVFPASIGMTYNETVNRIVLEACSRYPHLRQLTEETAA